MIKDIEYWNDIYSSCQLDTASSAFAQYIEKEYLGDRVVLLELGCGNGRDSLFFAQRENHVIALDLSSQAIENLSGLDVKNAQFVNQDFSRLSSYSNFDCVYSRFTMHSVDEETEDRVFQQLPGVLKKGGLFLMEARSKRDEELDKVFGKEHYRRYLDFEKTVAKLESLEFQILEKEESQGLSPYKQEDPFLMRIIAKKL